MDIVIKIFKFTGDKWFIAINLRSFGYGEIQE